MDISEIIFQSKNIVRGSAENFFFDDPSKYEWSLYKDVPERVQRFLNILKTEIAQYYHNIKRPINYEDVYYFLDFIEYNYYEEEGNPAFQYIFKEFETKIKELLSPLDPILEGSFELNRLLSESKMFMRQTVSKILSKRSESFIGFQFLKELLSLRDYTQIDIFSLNHDTVLEQFFENENVDFNDGFSKSNDKNKFWEPELFDQTDKIKLYKIHGSVHWYYYNSDDWEDNRIMKFPLTSITKFDTINSLILIGTYNKLSDYIKDLYLELYYRFYKALNAHNNLIIIGYGFNDRGINQKIFNWLYNPINSILIIDPKVEELRIKFPSYLFNQWGKNNRIRRIQDSIDKVSLEQIVSQIN